MIISFLKIIELSLQEDFFSTTHREGNKKEIAHKECLFY